MPRPWPVPPGSFGFQLRHGGDFLDNRARALVRNDRQPVGDRVLAGALGQFVDAAFHREYVRHGAKPAQRRGAHRRLGDQMMDYALGRDVVERLAVAGGAAAVRFRHVAGRRLRHRIGQGDRAEQHAAGAGPVVVRRAPDFLRPVDRLAGVVEEGLHLDDHGRRFRLVDEFLLAPPAHADRLARHLHGDDGGVGRGIVGAVVAVAARALHVVHGDLGGVDGRAPWRATRARGTRPGNASIRSDGRRDIRRGRRMARSRHARDSRGCRSPRSADGPAARRPARRRACRSMAAAAAKRLRLAARSASRRYAR